MRKFDETTLPSPEEKLKIFKYTIDFFEDNGSSDDWDGPLCKARR